MGAIWHTDRKPKTFSQTLFLKAFKIWGGLTWKIFEFSTVDLAMSESKVQLVAVPVRAKWRAFLKPHPKDTVDFKFCTFCNGFASRLRLDWHPCVYHFSRPPRVQLVG
jgi:hypothetical protein